MTFPSRHSDLPLNIWSNFFNFAQKRQIDQGSAKFDQKVILNLRTIRPKKEEKKSEKTLPKVKNQSPGSANPEKRRRHFGQTLDQMAKMTTMTFFDRKKVDLKLKGRKKPKQSPNFSALPKNLAFHLTKICQNFQKRKICQILSKFDEFDKFENFSGQNQPCFRKNRSLVDFAAY